MRLAFLISAHTDPQHLDRLIKSLPEESDFFIHVDAKSDLKIFEYTPLQVKQGICGYGRADKKQVQSMVKSLLNLKEIPKPDDAADALAIALGHLSTRRFSEMFRV